MDLSFGSTSASAESQAPLATALNEAGISSTNAETDPQPKPAGVRLSAREQSIVLLMGHGLSNKRIARQLSIAPETVKSHAKHIFWKLTVQSRAQAVYRAAALGLI
jgi:ATP/maltotriose-dependent transcriptional regulator MalT